MPQTKKNIFLSYTFVGALIYEGTVGSIANGILILSGKPAPD